MPKIFYSLTTTKQRVKDIEPSIDSLHSSDEISAIFINISWQTMSVLLEFLPDLSLRYPKLRLNLCEDTGPGSKLVPTIIWCVENQEEDAVIITVDDDVVYPKGHAEFLRRAHYDLNQMPVAFSGLTWLSNNLLQEHGSGREVDLLEGFSGVVYRPYFFLDKYKERLFALEKFLNYYYQCVRIDELRYSDDVIFSNWLVSRSLQLYMVQSGNNLLLTKSGIVSLVQNHGNDTSHALHRTRGGSMARYSECFRILGSSNAIKQRREILVQQISSEFQLDQCEITGLSALSYASILDAQQYLRICQKGNGNRFKATLSLTTLPQRTEKIEPLLRYFSTFLGIDSVVINIPMKCARFPSLDYIIPPTWHSIPKLIINRCQDFGPATKLMGTVYSEESNLNSTSEYIATVDDDTIYPVTVILELIAAARVNSANQLFSSGAFSDRECWGGIGFKLEHYFNPLSPNKPEFKRHGNGFSAEVDIIEGFGAILYSKSWFSSSDLIEPLNKFYHKIKHILFSDDDLLVNNWMAKVGISRHMKYSQTLSRTLIRQLDYGFQPDMGALHIQAASGDHLLARRELVQVLRGEGLWFL